MQVSNVVQGLILAAVLAASGYVVVRVVDGWADWVVLGGIVMTVIGAAIAVHWRRYPTKKRTFIRHSSDQRR